MADDTYTMLVDGELVQVDMGPVLRRSRAQWVEARAGLIAQAAALLMDPAFGLDESYSAAEAAMPGGMVNSAGNIAVVLREVELGL